MNENGIWVENITVPDVTRTMLSDDNKKKYGEFQRRPSEIT
jgi:hypothetical protein